MDTIGQQVNRMLGDMLVKRIEAQILTREEVCRKSDENLKQCYAIYHDAMKRAIEAKAKRDKRGKERCLTILI